MTSRKQQLPDHIIGKGRRHYASSGKKEEIVYGIGKSTLGPIVVATTAKGVVSILLGENVGQLVDDLGQRFPKAHIHRDDIATVNAIAEVVRLIESPGETFDYPLDIRGTPFQQRVWKELLGVPAGQTTTYTEVATKIGAPKAIRAVGNACSVNNLAVAVPCHRVLRKDGSLSGGYHWGDERQRTLIAREATQKSKGR
jgi:AraC family transcriptional regulator, regulatory protein of adaptative response / methylated-DNA-[protein]-cysteine methyltransferase